MAKEKQFDWKEGQAVNIIDDFNIIDTVDGERAPVILTGNIERLTPTRVIVRTSNGDTALFRRKDSRQVGYSWPILTNALRPQEGSDEVR